MHFKRIVAGTAAAAMCMAAAAVAGSTQTPDAAPAPVYIVRHAERADAAPSAHASSTRSMSSGADPALSPAGKARADRLAAMLGAAGITRIFTTEYVRTRQTAEPLASAANARITVVPANDVAGLVKKLAEPGGPALVVGHSNTVPDILKALGVADPPRIADTEYDNLFIAVRAAGDATTLLKLKF